MPREAGEWIAMRQIRAPSEVVSHAPEAIAWGAIVRRIPVFSRTPALGQVRRLGLAQRSQRKLPGLAQAEPQSRRAASTR